MCSSTFFRRGRRAACVFALIAASAGGLSGQSFGLFARKPLAYTRIDLNDGRSLRNVEIRSFDAASNKVLVRAERSAMTLPLALFPAPVQEKIRRDAPASGGTVSVAPSTKPVPVAPQPPPTVVQIPRPPAATAPTEEQVIQMHRNAALAHAVRYFRYEYQVGSGSVRVKSVDFDATPTRAVPGWTGRYETAGTAYLEYFDAAGITVGRAKCHFEVQTEANPGEPLRVVNFEHRS